MTRTQDTTPMGTSIHKWTHTHTHTCGCICMYVSVYMCVCISIYIYVYVYVCVHVCMYINGKVYLKCLHGELHMAVPPNLDMEGPCR